MQKRWHLPAISKTLRRKLENKQANGCLKVRHQSHCGLFWFCYTSLSAHLPIEGYWGRTFCDMKDIWYHSDNNYCIMGPKLKRTFSSLKHHRTLWLDLRRFVSRGCFFCETEGCSRLEGTEQRSCLWLCVFWDKLSSLSVWSRRLLMAAWLKRLG